MNGAFSFLPNPTDEGPASEGRRVMLESFWQDAVVRGLLAGGVSLGVQWVAPKAVRLYRRLRANLAASPTRRASDAPRVQKNQDASERAETRP